MSLEVPIILAILAIAIFFTCKWILKKRNIGNTKNRALISIISASILSPLLYVATITAFIIMISFYPENEFNQNEWSSNVDVRYEMSNDIIESRLLIGKTKDQVIELLGNDFSTKHESRISYSLGHVPGLFNIDPDYLEIKFENGVAMSVRQYEG